MVLARPCPFPLPLVGGVTPSKTRALSPNFSLSPHTHTNTESPASQEEASAVGMFVPQTPKGSLLAAHFRTKNQPEDPCRHPQP